MSRGNRRFVVVWCPDSFASVAGMRNEQAGEVGALRDQCWTEAIQRYLAGERANLPRELIPAQAQVNGHFQNTDEALEKCVCGVMTKIEKAGTPPYPLLPPLHKFSHGGARDSYLPVESTGQKS